MPIPANITPPHNPLQAVRDTCAHVAEYADHITLNTHILDDFVTHLPRELLSSPDDDPARSPLPSIDLALLFVLTLNAINYGSGTFPYLHKIPGTSGYHTIATYWRDYIQENHPSWEDLTRLTLANCTAIFHQEDNTHPIIHTLMCNFTRSIRTLSTHIRERHRDARTLLATQETAESLVRELIHIEGYNDCTLYKGFPVFFYKRAQITCTDLALHPQTSALFAPDDLDRLTIFADNLVPHVLHTDGVLRYSKELETKLQSGAAFREGDPMEVEMRACAVHACECIVRYMCEREDCISSRALDIILWRKGQERQYWGPVRHRCITTFY